MNRSLLAATALILAAGCASRTWVDQRLEASEQRILADQEKLNQDLVTSRVDPLDARLEEAVGNLDDRITALPERFVSHAELTPLGERIARVRSEVEQATREQYTDLNARVSKLSNALAQRDDLQKQLVSAVDELNNARADFAQHRATVDNRVSQMEAEAKELLAALTELDERIQEFFYNEFKNLQRKRESLLAEVDLIDQLVRFLAQREPISLLNTEGEIASPGSMTTEPPVQDQTEGKQDEEGKPGGG